MTARAYYNDTNKAAVAVLRQLIVEGVIPFGEVDDRSIEDVLPDDLRGFTQCHFFAGGGLWPVAARLAGWPDERPIWTGSCPCQPYSVAGKGLGEDDPRHLWPHFLYLIRGAKARGFGPPIVMGEQVSGKAGYGWLDGVRADLAKEGYACRARDIPALAVDAPHERNRLYWLAVDNSVCDGQWQQVGEIRSGRHATHYADGNVVDLVDTDNERREELRRTEPVRAEQSRTERATGRNGSFWADAEWIICHDGKARRTKPGLPLLVDGFPGRVDLWSIAGNAISPILAAEVIGAFLDIERSAA